MPANPVNPNDENIRRDEPAVPPQPDFEEAPQDPTAALSEILDNPKTVQAVKEFLAAEDLSLDEVTVEQGFWNWSEGADCARVEAGDREYFISPDGETTTALAVAMVTNDLEESPDMFNQSFIESYIDEDRLRDALMSDVEEQIRESPESYGLEPEEVEEPEPQPGQQPLQFEEPKEPEITDDQITEKAEEILRDPVSYLGEIYGREDAIKEAIRIAGIDIEKAAEEAVAADGEGHFLSTYDGNIYDLPSGGQYWRHN